jgi:hypothetical protein
MISELYQLEYPFSFTKDGAYCKFRSCNATFDGIQLKHDSILEGLTVHEIWGEAFYPLIDAVNVILALHSFYVNVDVYSSGIATELLECMFSRDGLVLRTIPEEKYASVTFKTITEIVDAAVVLIKEAYGADVKWSCDRLNSYLMQLDTIYTEAENEITESV